MSNARRRTDEIRWTAERKKWLALSSTLGADPARRARLAAAPISGDVAADSRALYMASAEASVRAARADKRWKVVSRIRRAQAANLYEEAGRPLPPPDDVLALHRDALLAELRGHLTTSKVAELASSGCCAACRKDDGHSFKIADELRDAAPAPRRLPEGPVRLRLVAREGDPRQASTPPQGRDTRGVDGESQRGVTLVSRRSQRPGPH